MRGHDKSIISLSWCPVPYNVFPRNTIKRIADPKQSDEKSVEHNIDASKGEIKDEEVNLKENINEIVTVDSELNNDNGVQNNIIETSETVPENQEQTSQNNEDVQESHLDDRNDNQCNTIVDGKTITDVQLEEENKDQPIVDVACDSNTIPIEENDKQPDSNDVVITDASLGEENDDNQPTIPHVDEVVAPNTALNEENDVELANVSLDLTKLPKEYLLASSARGGSIFIWRAGTDGRKQTELYMSGGKKRNYRSADKLWISLCWIAPHILLSSSPVGELLYWDLAKINKNM